MRLLYFSMGYGPHDHRFLAALARTQHEVYFLRLARSSRDLEERPLPAEVRQVHWAGGHRQFRWRDTIRLLRDLKRVIRDVKPELIHAGPIQSCAFLAILSGFQPVLTMSWGFDLMQDADRNAWWRWVTRYTLRRSTYFVSDARVTRARAVALGMPVDRTAVFAWGVDLNRFRPGRDGDIHQRGGRTQTRLRGRAIGSPLQSRSFVVFCNRSWEPMYGVDVLARAFVIAARKKSDLSLILLGDGSQRDAIRQILEGGTEHHRVRLAGQVRQADLPRWYRAAQLFVSPSHVDGSSVSLMEALACGTPVLVSDIPGNREWVEEDVNGWLFRDGDVQHLAQQILRISRRRGSLSRIGRAARRTAEARADWASNFQVLLRSYERATTLSHENRK